MSNLFLLPEKPQDRLGHCIQDVDPHLQRGGVDLVQLIEVAIDDGVLGEAVLGPSGDHDGLGDLFSRRGLGAHQIRGQPILEGQTIHGSLVLK